MSFNDVCSSNDECSFKQCITCDIQENGPSDSEGTGLNEVHPFKPLYDYV
ncbi:hypothetical protein H8356DRAFT_1340916 [Neocallimastix lanati (nom. inval.)]|nr:hypothetical protein H8356DRAFT_1340916 [Neocallimastix sp. JGI-2020a]